MCIRDSVITAWLAVLGFDDLVGVGTGELADQIGEVVVQIELVTIDRAVGIDREACEADDRLGFGSAELGDTKVGSNLGELLESDFFHLCPLVGRSSSTSRSA